MEGDGANGHPPRVYVLRRENPFTPSPARSRWPSLILFSLDDLARTLNESPMSASDQHQTPEVAWRRHPVVRRLAQCLTVGLLAAGGLWFSPLLLGRSGTRAFAACLAIVTILAVVTFLAAVATRDISVALGSGFALALAAIYWFIAITFGMTDLVRLRSSMPVVSSKSPNHATERTATGLAFTSRVTKNLTLHATRVDSPLPSAHPSGYVHVASA